MSNNPHFTPDIRLLRKKYRLDPCIGITEMSRRIAAETGLPQLDVYAVLKRWVDHTTDAVVRGVRVRMPGLGVFTPTFHRKRSKIYFYTASDFKARLERAATTPEVTPEVTPAPEVPVTRRYC